MKKTRQLHLWIGLICSVFILLQSVTGLLLSEKWILGGEGEGGQRPAFGQMQQMSQQDSGTGMGSGTDNGGVADGSSYDASAAGSGDSSQSQDTDGMPGGQAGFGMRGPGGEGSGTIGFIKNLHEGKIGDTDVSLLIDAAAIGMIILTLTGIILSIKTLRAQRRSRLKRQSA
ncbi:PepSY-associated TM helix domain-containing protein [Cohnella suwonensis]|uniref:PepSY-associated TM helix domain-containing protein n=1 Tax=Cohnella suwonensis TaxID=696072 RepID=A0ABW0LUE0_9BACL